MSRVPSGQTTTHPVPVHATGGPNGDLPALREQLQRAIESENFELAARLRDEIRARE